MSKKFVQPAQSEFMQRASDALEKYDRLRAGGMSHAMAIHASGFYDCIVKPEPQRYDVKQAQAGRDG